MDRKHQSSFINTQHDSQAIRTGPINLRKRSAFTGSSWKSRRLELYSQYLTIINPANNKRTRIELRGICELERTNLTNHSIRLKARGKVYNFSFATDPELYDWQEDIYNRCPLGNYSAPFNFVHKSHIGTDNITGTFTDPNILPIYAQIVSGQPAVSKTASGVIVTPRSRPSSGGPLLPLNAKPIQKAMLTPSGPGSSLLEGQFPVKLARFFQGWVWKDRWLTVTPQNLVIHQTNTKNSSASKTIPLFNVTRVEPDSVKHGCLIVEYTRHTPSGTAVSQNSSKADVLFILFKSYDELYTWRDALYDRSQLSAPIGKPTGFKHNVHVGFDTNNGQFLGLPQAWQTVNPTSSKAENPAVVPVSPNKLRRRQSKRSPDTSEDTVSKSFQSRERLRGLA